jgi:hydroxypyruvate reductase
MSLRQTLLSLYPAALKAVNGRLVVKASLREGNYQQVCQQHCHLIAIGKAAESMSLGAIEQLGGVICSGLIITKQGHFSASLCSDRCFQCIEANHPIPAQASLAAGQQLLHYIQKLPENAHCLVLISGGTSSLVEVLQRGWTLDELQQITAYLLANAYSIEEINAVRRYISTIKAGGLWRYLQQRKVTCLMLSDVADNDPAVIGSGLLFPSVRDVPLRFPHKWSSRFNYSVAMTTPRFDWKIIATLEQAKQAVASLAFNRGYRVLIDPDFLEGDAVIAAKHCVRQLQDSDIDMMVWGGETTVELPDNAPVGGRNQHFALAVAIEIAGCDCAFLCLGTDGSDGSSDVAGALVDGQTVQRGKSSSFSANKHLQQLNAHEFLRASGDLILTGATGTNVMDIVIGIKLFSNHPVIV